MDAWTVLRISDFEQQIAVLRRYYEIVSLDEALRNPHSNSARPRVVLTFDDGDVGLHTYLLPLVERIGIPVTIYIATQQIQEGRPYWFDRVMNAAQTDEPITLNLEDESLGLWTLSLSRGRGNWATVSALLEALKAIDPARRQGIVDKIAMQTIGKKKRRTTPLAPLSLAQMGDLAASHWITIGCHSHCHNLLDQIPLKEALISAETSRQRLREWTSQSAAHFAYPNGNFSDELVQGIKDLGFRSATILSDRHWNGRSCRFMLPRVSIGRYDDINRFKARLLGF